MGQPSFEEPQEQMMEQNIPVDVPNAADIPEPISSWTNDELIPPHPHDEVPETTEHVEVPATPISITGKIELTLTNFAQTWGIGTTAVILIIVGAFARKIIVRFIRDPKGTIREWAAKK